MRNLWKKLTLRIALVPRSTICSLLFVRCPSAIFWAVWSVVIDPIQRESNRTISHIRKEILERINPSFTNHDSPTTVSVPVLRSAIATAVLNSVPRIVRPCSALSVFEAPGIIFRGFIPNTAATAGVSCPHSICLNDYDGTAITFAFTPHPSRMTELRNDFKSPVFMSDVV